MNISQQNECMDFKVEIVMSASNFACFDFLFWQLNLTKTLFSLVFYFFLHPGPALSPQSIKPHKKKGGRLKACNLWQFSLTKKKSQSWHQRISYSLSSQSTYRLLSPHTSPPLSASLCLYIFVILFMCAFDRYLFFLSLFYFVWMLHIGPRLFNDCCGRIHIVNNFFFFFGGVGGMLWKQEKRF